MPGASITYRSPRFALRVSQGLADVEAGAPLQLDALLRVASVVKTHLGSLAALFLAALRPTDTTGYGLGLERNGECYLHHGTFTATRRWPGTAPTAT